MLFGKGLFINWFKRAQLVFLGKKQFFLCGELKYFPRMIKNNGTYGNPTFRLKGENR